MTKSSYVRNYLALRSQHPNILPSYSYSALMAMRKDLLADFVAFYEKEAKRCRKTM